jgi:hypothetical protein
VLDLSPALHNTIIASTYNYYQDRESDRGGLWLKRCRRSTSQMMVLILQLQQPNPIGMAFGRGENG